MSFARPPTYILKYYWRKRVYFFELCLYTYFVSILIVKCAKYIEQVFEFKELYPHKSDLIQKHLTKSGTNFLIALIGNLF